jgi:hypothetical protein
MDPFPLTPDTVFYTVGETTGMAAAAIFVATSATVYPGQILTAEQVDGSFKTYTVNADKTMTEHFTGTSTVPMANVDGLSSTLSGYAQRLTTLEGATVNLSNYSGTAISLTASQGITLAATGGLTLTGSSMTFNGDYVITTNTHSWSNLVGKPASLEYNTNKNISGGYAGLDLAGYLLSSQFNIDSTLQVSNGKLGIKQLTTNTTYSVSAVTDDKPTVTAGIAASAIAVGDQIVFITTIGSYTAGNLYRRVRKTDHTIATDYVILTQTVSVTMDTLAQGTTNKYISADMLTFLGRLGVNVLGNLTLDGTAVDTFGGEGQPPPPVFADPDTFGGDGTDNNPLTLLEGIGLTVSDRTFFDRLGEANGKLTFDNVVVGSDASASFPVFSAFFSGSGTVQSPITLATGTMSAPSGWTYDASKIASGTLSDDRLSSAVKGAPARITKLEQADIVFTSSDLVDGILTFEAMKFPVAICENDYTHLLSVGPASVTDKDLTGKRTFTLDLTGLTITGTWLVLFD